MPGASRAKITTNPDDHDVLIYLLAVVVVVIAVVVVPVPYSCDLALGGPVPDRVLPGAGPGAARYDTYGVAPSRSG